MTIRDIQSGAQRPDSLQSGSSGGAEHVQHSDAPERSGTDQANNAEQVQDRVEISDAARTALEAQDAEQPMLDFARKALLGIPPLSQDRAEDILIRIREGFYSQPEIVKLITERVQADLTGRTEADLPDSLPGE